MFNVHKRICTEVIAFFNLDANACRRVCEAVVPFLHSLKLDSRAENSLFHLTFFGWGNDGAIDVDGDFFVFCMGALPRVPAA